MIPWVGLNNVLMACMLSPTMAVSSEPTQDHTVTIIGSSMLGGIGLCAVIGICVAYRYYRRNTERVTLMSRRPSESTDSALGFQTTHDMSTNMGIADSESLATDRTPSPMSICSDIASRERFRSATGAFRLSQWCIHSRSTKYDVQHVATINQSGCNINDNKRLARRM